MKKVIIIGSGGHAAEIRDYINHHNVARPSERLEVVGFLDDNSSTHVHYGFSEEYLGGIEAHAIVLDTFYIMGIANLKYRKGIVQEFKMKGATFISLIHPTALISPSAHIGEGVVISHNASVGPKAVVGDFNVLNSRCTVGHDTKMGSFNFISPQTALSGNTKIGNENMFGTNSATIPGIQVGNQNKIGAGMIVYKNIADNETVFNRMKERIIIKGADL